MAEEMEEGWSGGHQNQPPRSPFQSKCPSLGDPEDIAEPVQKVIFNVFKQFLRDLLEVHKEQIEVENWEREQGLTKPNRTATILLTLAWSLPD